MPETSARHVHNNVITALLVLGYVLVGGAALKYTVTRVRIPGLTELVNYVF